MKVAKLYDYFTIRIEEMPIPKIGAHEALLKTKVSGICSGDVMPWYIERKAPLVLGHEPAGQIIEVGKNVTSFQPGARVFIHHHAPCCSCRYCQRGDYVHCNSWKQIGIVPGGISEYILVNERNLEIDTHSLSDNLAYEDGTLVEPTACVVKSLKKLSVRQGDTILVLGLGVMGQLHVILSKSSGAGKIIGADKVPFRLEKAREFGADEVIDVSKLGGETVKFGATVTLVDEDTDEEKKYQIVGDLEADVKEGRVSISSPIARALIGKTVGDSIEVTTPGGSRAYEILEVKFV